MPKVPIALPMSGGVNLFNKPRDIQDSEVVRAKNLVPVIPGRLRTRGASVVQGTVLLVTNGYPIGLHFLPISSPARLIIYTRGSELGGVTQMAAYNGFDSGESAIASASFGVVTRFSPASIAYGGKVYAFGGFGSSVIGKILEQDIGGPVHISNFTFSTAGNENLRPCFVGIYRDRFIYANFGPGNESTLVFADPYNPRAIEANILTAIDGDRIPVNPDDGDRIVGGIEILQTGASVATNSYLVLKEYSAYLLSGEPLESDGGGTDSIEINRMPINCGCSSPDTIVTTPYGILWTGPDDVWFFPEGQLPYRLGTKIRPILQQTPTNVRYRWHAAYHNGFYKLAVHSAGAGPGDDDRCGEQWWLDLRAGPPPPGPDAWRQAIWWGPQIFNFAQGAPVVGAYGTRCMAVDTNPGSDRQLYGAESTGDATGYVMSFDSTSSHDSYDGGSVLQHDFSQIEAELVTKDMVEIMSGERLVADAIMEKGLDGIELDAVPSAAGVMAWKWILNQGKTIGAEQTVEVSPQSGLLLGTGVLNTVTLTDEFSAVPLDPSPNRVVGRGIQLQIYSKAGYYIDSTNDLFVVDIEVTTAVYVRFRVPLTRGFYVDVNALGAHIIATLNALLTGYGLMVTYSRSAGIVFTLSVGRELNFGLGHCAAADAEKVRSLAQLLGFSLWDGDYEGANSVTATDVVYTKNVPTWEFGGARMLMYPIRRRLL